MSDENNLYLGTKGHVVCINKQSGSEVWRTKLRGAEITTLLVHDNALYAGANGFMYALDPQSGNILWENPLKGLGHGVITMGAD